MADTELAPALAEAVEQTDAQIWEEIVAQVESDAAPEIAAPEPDPEPAEIKADEPAPAPPAAVDIWADATPEQRAEVQRLQEKDRRYRGAISAKQKAINALQDKLKPVTADDPDMARLAEEYPDVTGPILKQQAAMQEQLSTMAEIAKLQREAAQDIEQHAWDEQAELLDAQHPNWGETIRANQAAFFTWVDDQPKRIRDTVAANMAAVTDAAALGEVMTDFKAHLNPQAATPAPPNDLKAKRQLQLQGARDTAPRGAVATTADPMDGLTDETAIYNALVKQMGNRL